MIADTADERPDVRERPKRAKRCPRCRGEGRFNPGYPNPQTEVDCAYCGGDGEVAA